MNNIIAFSPRHKNAIGETPMDIIKTYRKMAEIHQENAIRELKAARALLDCAILLEEGTAYDK